MVGVFGDGGKTFERARSVKIGVEIAETSVGGGTVTCEGSVNMEVQLWSGF